MTTEADRVAATRGLVPVLVGVTLVISIVSSLGAPLLPEVAQSLDVSLDAAQWSLTAALLAGTIAAPVLGRLGDGPHRREAILGALAVVFVGSIIAGLADSIGVLVAGRAMQGVGLGVAPVTMAVARDLLPADRVAGVIGLLSVSAAAGVGVGLSAQRVDRRLAGRALRVPVGRRDQRPGHRRDAGGRPAQHRRGRGAAGRPGRGGGRGGPGRAAARRRAGQHVGVDLGARARPVRRRRGDPGGLGPSAAGDRAPARRPAADAPPPGVRRRSRRAPARPGAVRVPDGRDHVRADAVGKMASGSTGPRSPPGSAWCRSRSRASPPARRWCR